MPLVTIKTGIADASGKEEILVEYICDWEGCREFVTEVLGFVRELGMAALFCDEHIRIIRARNAAA